MTNKSKLIDKLNFFVTFFMFFYQEINSAFKKFLKQMGDQKLITDKMSYAKPKPVMYNECKELYDLKYPKPFANDNL